MNKPEIEEFQISRSKHKRFRVSALFNTVTQLRETNSELLKSVKVIDGSNKPSPVYFLEFNNPPRNVLFEQGFRFQEHHLTIHRTFKDAKQIQYKNNTSIAHYTAVYKHEQNKSSIRAHVYLNREGLISHLQVQLHNNDERTTLTLNPMEQQLLGKNADIAIDLMKELVFSCEKTHENKLKLVEEIDQQLTRIGNELSTSTYSNYIKTAQSLIDAIQEANKYALCEADRRAELLATQINSLRQGVYQATAGQVDEPEEDKEDVIPEKEKIKKVISTITEYRSIYNEIATLNSSLETIFKHLDTEPDNYSLLEQQEIIMQRLSFNYLLITPYISNLSLNETAVVKVVNQNLARKMISAFSLFMNQFWRGDIKSFKKLYPYIEEKIDRKIILKSFFYEFIANISDSPKDRAKRNEVFDFLYEKNFLFRTLFHAENLFFVDENQLITLLILCCKNKNFSAYKFFLKKGLSPNATGAILGGNRIPAIAMIVYYAHRMNDQRYIELAVQFGARYDCRISKSNYNIMTYCTDEKNPFSKGGFNNFGLKNIPKELMNFANVLNRRGSILDIVDVESDIKTVSLFYNQFTLEDQLKVFVDLLNTPSVTLRHLFGVAEASMVVVKSTAKDELTKQITCNSGEYLCVTLSSENDGVHALLQDLVVAIRTKIINYKYHSGDFIEKII